MGICCFNMEDLRHVGLSSRACAHAACTRAPQRGQLPALFLFFKCQAVIFFQRPHFGRGPRFFQDFCSDERDLRNRVSPYRMGAKRRTRVRVEVIRRIYKKQSGDVVIKMQIPFLSASRTGSFESIQSILGGHCGGKRVCIAKLPNSVVGPVLFFESVQLLKNSTSACAYNQYGSRRWLGFSSALHTE